MRLVLVRRVFRGLDNARLLRPSKARAAYDRGGPAVPDVTPCLSPGEVRRWISFDQHKFSIVAAVLPPEGGKPEVCRIETTEVRSAGSSTSRAARRACRCATRPGPAGSRCGGC